MTQAETEALAKRIRKADGNDDLVEPMVKELLFGMAVNMARIADRLDRPVPL
jgi:hypothetical protein